MALKECKVSISVGLTFAACFLIKKVFWILLYFIGLSPWCGAMLARCGMMKGAAMMCMAQSGGCMILPFLGGVAVGTVFKFIWGVILGWIFVKIFNNLKCKH